MGIACGSTHPTCYTDPASVERRTASIKVVSYGKEVTALNKVSAKRITIERTAKRRK